MSATAPRPVRLPPISELRRICQEPVRGFALRHDPAYRFVSIHLTRLAIRARLTPHQVTVISLGCGLAAALALAGESVPRLLAGVLLLQAYLLLDYVDGELARFRQLASMGGRYLEQAGCYAVDPIILLGLSWGAAVQYDSDWLLVSGVVGAITQLYFRLAPVLITAVITSVRMGQLDRGGGEATPAPQAEPPLDVWGRALERSHRVYRRLRFPYFHPNFLLLLSFVAALDAGLQLWGLSPWACTALVIFYGLTTPLMALWQVLIIVHTRVVDRRYLALYQRGETFREHI